MITDTAKLSSERASENVWGCIRTPALVPPGEVAVRSEGRNSQSSCPPLNSFDGLVGHQDVIQAVRTRARQLKRGSEW